MPDELDTIKNEIAAVQRRVAKAEYEKDMAGQALEAARKNLKELGLESEEQAQEAASKLREDLAQELAKIQDALKVIE